MPKEKQLPQHIEAGIRLSPSGCAALLAAAEKVQEAKQKQRLVGLGPEQEP